MPINFRIRICLNVWLSPCTLSSFWIKPALKLLLLQFIGSHDQTSIQRNGCLISRIFEFALHSSRRRSALFFLFFFRSDSFMEDESQMTMVGEELKSEKLREEAKPLSKFFFFQSWKWLRDKSLLCALFYGRGPLLRAHETGFTKWSCSRY